MALARCGAPAAVSLEVADGVWDCAPPSLLPGSPMEPRADGGFHSPPLRGRPVDLG